MRPLTTLGVALASATAALGQSPLTTTFQSSTFLAGSGVTVFFDLQVRTAVQINQIDVNFFGTAGTAVTVDFWTRSGTHVGNAGSAAGWNLAGSSNPGTSNGRDVPTPMTFATPITLQPGLWGIAVEHIGLGAAYTVGTSVGNVFASTAEMDFLEGGSGRGFNGIQNAPRVMNCSIHYTPLAGFAAATPYGAGCAGSSRFATYYENFPLQTFDLGGAPGAENTISHVFAGTDYAVLPGSGAWFTPTSPDLGLMGTEVSPAQPLGFTLTLPDGTQTTDIWICSEGYIWLTSNTAADFTPSTNEFLSQGPRLAPCWMSLDPPAGGTIHFDIDPVTGTAYATWLNVAETGVAGSTITMQVAIDQSGTIEYRYGTETISTLGNTFALVGLTPGTGGLDPSNRDISATLPFLLGPDMVVPDISLSSDRPIEGTTMNVTIDNMPSTAVFGVLALSGTQVLPGIQPISGLDNCVQLLGSLDPVYFLPTGSTEVLAVPVPAGIFTGATLYAQAIVLAPGVNQAGVASSNGLEWLIDIN